MRVRPKQVILVLAAMVTCSLDANLKPTTTEKAFEQGRIIVDATVLSSKAVEWQASASYRTCGFELELRTNETLDGTEIPNLIIASPDPLIPGGRYLLFLQEREGGFPIHHNSAWPTDIQRKVDDCVAKLPSLKSGWLPTSQIVNLVEPLLIMSGPKQSILLDSAMTFEVKEIEFNAGPHKLTADDVRCTLLGGACENRTIYLWTEFREWLKANLPDKVNKSLNADASDAGAG